MDAFFLQEAIKQYDINDRHKEALPSLAACANDIQVSVPAGHP